MVAPKLLQFPLLMKYSTLLLNSIITDHNSTCSVYWKEVLVKMAAGAHKMEGIPSLLGTSDLCSGKCPFPAAVWSGQTSSKCGLFGREQGAAVSYIVYTQGSGQLFAFFCDDGKIRMNQCS